MTSVTTTDLDLPGAPATNRSPDPVVHGRSCPHQQVVRRRLRLDHNGSMTGPGSAGPASSGDEPGAAVRRHRSSLCLTERILRHSPARLRTTVLLLIAVAVLGGVMVATLGLLGLALLVGMSALSWYQCARSTDRPGR